MCEPFLKHQPVYCRHKYASKSKHAEITISKSGQSAAYEGLEMGYTLNNSHRISYWKIKHKAGLESNDIY